MRNYAPSFRKNYANMVVLFWFLFFFFQNRSFCPDSLSFFHIPVTSLACSSGVHRPHEAASSRCSRSWKWEGNEGKKRRGKRERSCVPFFSHKLSYDVVWIVLYLAIFFHYVPPQFCQCCKALQHFFPLYILVSPWVEEMGWRNLVSCLGWRNFVKKSC